MLIRKLFLALCCLGSAAAPAQELPAFQNAYCLTPKGGRLPSFLPDGKEIAYVQDGPKGQQVVVLEIATHKTRLIGRPGDVQSLAVSPDGKWAVVTSGLIFARRIELMNLEDGNRKKLTGGPGFRSTPCWVDGGARLLFSFHHKDKNLWIKIDPFTEPPTSQEVKPLGPGEPTVSPSGNLIALVRRDEQGAGLLKIVRKDGTLLADIPPVTPTSSIPVRGCYDPAFSSDDRYLVYVRSDIQPASDIFLRDLKTGRETPLTTDRADNQSPVFSPDGTAVIYVSVKEGNQHRLWLGRMKKLP